MFTKHLQLGFILAIIFCSCSSKNKDIVVNSLNGFDTGRIEFAEVYASFNGRNTDYRVIEMRVKFDGYGGTTTIQDSTVHLLNFDLELINVDLENTSSNNRYFYGNKLQLNNYGVMLYAKDGVTMSQRFFHDEFANGFVLDKYKNYKVSVPITNFSLSSFEKGVKEMEKFKIFIRGFSPGVFYREDIAVKK